jgi:hypothetical protein
MAKVMKVLDVQLTQLKTNPVQLEIDATGEVSSSGWSNSRLEPRVYIQFPADGIQDFDFVADPPKELAQQVISHVAASQTWANPPMHQLKGVRVHSANNAIEAYL